MKIEEFQISISQDKTVPADLSPALKALWYDRKGDWNAAHIAVQPYEDSDSCYVHAYLHRKEGDIGNADYWYGRAGEERPNLQLSQPKEAYTLQD